MAAALPPPTPPPLLLPLLLLPLLLLLLSAAVCSAAPAPADAAVSAVEEGGAGRPIVTFQAGFPRRGLRRLLGEVSGVAVAANSHSFLFHRADRSFGPGDFDQQEKYTKQSDGPISSAAIVEVDEHGDPVAAFGENLFYLPHGISVDNDGKVWTTDVARHQVLRVDPNSGKVDLAVGEKFVPGNDKEHFCKPTKVAVAASGEFFVADGYCNNRIVKFDKDGKYVAEFGKKPKGDAPAADNELAVPHGLSLLERLDLLCVADRENRRVQCFKAGLKDPKEFGKFVQSVSTELGRVFDVAFTPTGKLLILHSMDDQFSLVNVYDLVDDVTVGQFTFVSAENDIDAVPVGFGRGHAVASAPSGKFALVSSLDALCDSVDSLCEMGMEEPYQVFRFNIEERRSM